MRRLDLRGASGDLAALLPRPTTPADGPVDAVREIVEAVRDGGDAAVLAFTAKFDGVTPVALTLGPDDLAAALGRISTGLRGALEEAASRIRSYHEAQLPADVTVEHPGLSIRGVHRPVERAACYVPGGRAVYPSTVLMTAVPAAVAGVEEVVVCVPPGPDGAVPDVVLAAAAIAGVGEVIAVGGAQAIAAVAHGTETIRPVDVIVGPGNVYVALAKQQVAGLVGVPSAFAGPSEVVVVADGSASAEFAAIDVIVQAEHGPDGLAWFVSWDEAFTEDVVAEIQRLVTAAPRRAEIESTLATGGIAVLCDSPEQAMDVANFVAPEHLQLQTAVDDDLLHLVRHAGAIFCGAHAPASLGDYAAGPSHVLPTNGSARFASALTVRDFMKDLHVVRVDSAGLDTLGDTVETLALAEGLHAHAASVSLRRGRG